VHTTKVFLPPHLLSRPDACLVNVSSMGGFLPVPGQTVYGANKAAVKLLTEGLYSELKDSPVAVTIVFPGGVATDITGNSGVRTWAATATRAPQPRSSRPRRTPPRQIVEGVERGSYRVVIGKDARMLDRFSRLAPQRATDLIAKKMAALVGK
jgi:short-subunit dehydrogenase